MKKNNITPNLRKDFTQTSNKPLKKLNIQEREIYKNILETLDFEKYKHKSGESKSSRYKISKTIFREHILEVQGVKIVIPSNIIDIYTSLEILLGLKISGQTNTLTEASNLIDELYKRSEIQNEQQYRNAPNKFST